MPNAHLRAALKAQAEERKAAKKVATKKTSAAPVAEKEAAKPADSNTASTKEN